MIKPPRILAGLILLPLLLCAMPAYSDGSPQRSAFISPEVSGSLFVTDKGSWDAEGAGDTGKGFNWNVHTGDYNFLFIPSLVAGYMKAPWSLGLRYAYPMQFARLDLPNGRSAKGIIRGTEIGAQFAYALKESVEYRFYVSASLSARVSGEGPLDVYGGGKKLFSSTFEPDRLMRNYTVLLSAWYDWKGPDTFSWGLVASAMYSSLDLVASADNSIPLGTQRLDLSVFSVLVGARVRFDLPLSRN